MSRQWLFTRDALRTRAALLEDGCLLEYYEELCVGAIRRGSIYAGIARDVAPAIEAAFVEVAPGEKVFLQQDTPDALPQTGERVMVQIAQAARRTKAPRASRELKLPGRFVVLMVGADHVGVSRRITDTARREALRAALQQQAEQFKAEGLDQEFGVIVRSRAASEDLSVMEAELRSLLRACLRIQERFASEQQARGSLPVCLHEELLLPLRLLRDRVMATDQVLIDAKDLFDEATALLGELRATLGACVSDLPASLEFSAEGPAPLFERAGVEDQLREAAERQVMLPGGGSIVIDFTEALIAIDVNSGSSAGGDSLEATAFQTNSEAAVAVARQLRLRNIAGLVIVDFIEMRDPAHNEELMHIFTEALSDDPARIRLLPLDELGLAKLTRKKQ
ncbi:MAG: ribonuclease E/G [Coriobacteriia bacterium]|nr:ribonuclease E/G [Coriobacteriia bacterium]